jgi:hypothetical protein
MITTKKRIVHYLIFFVVAGICVFLSYGWAGWAAYKRGMGPPEGTGEVSMRIDHARTSYDEVKALLIRETEGKLISEEEYFEFIRITPRTERDVGDSSESKSFLCFATKTWAMRVFFNDKGIAIAYELRW